jgi:2-polyprenyl-3-methyl-5-hydroxy-6-metoxy-1,4-benzoquinol methylase
MSIQSTLKERSDSAALSRKEWISCNACGADAFQELSIADGWHIGRCRHCSLIYLNPMPFFAPSEEFSRMSLEFQYTRFQRNLTPEALEHDKAQMKRQFEVVARLANGMVPPGRFLDVGCGSGTSVSAAADIGWDAIGIDIDPVLIELGRNAFHVDLRCGTLPDRSLASSKFHFIRLRDVIEHLPNPYEVLGEVKRLLVPGGVGLIATPNEVSLPAQIRLTLGFARDRIATVAPPHHVHGFSPDALARTIRRADLRLLELTTITPVNTLYVTARNMRSSNILRDLMWRLAATSGKGSMLIAWFQKDYSAN